MASAQAVGLLVCTLILSCLLCLLSPVEGESDLVRLYRSLMTDYEKDVRPALNHTHTLNVTFGYSLTQLIDVDERNQILTTNAWINQNWIDYQLRWDPLEFNNITVMHIPHDKIWKSDIVLYNNADSHYATAIMSTDVFVTWDGNVTWLAAAIFKSSCHMNVRYYPFDEQRCLMKFASWAYDGSKIDIMIVAEKGDESNYMKSTEWELQRIGVKKNLNYFSCCPQPFPDVDVTIHIQRRPMFYVFNLILPCVLITGVALLGFYMPSESGEKVTLGITTLLSMTVFLMLVAESMPPTSDTLPLIGMYYGVTISIVTLATGMTVFTLNVHHKGVRGQPVSPWMRKIVFGYCAKLVFITVPEDKECTCHNYRPSVIPNNSTEALKLLSNHLSADDDNDPLNKSRDKSSFPSPRFSPNGSVVTAAVNRTGSRWTNQRRRLSPLVGVAAAVVQQPPPPVTTSRAYVTTTNSNHGYTTNRDHATTNRDHGATTNGNYATPPPSATETLFDYGVGQGQTAVRRVPPLTSLPTPGTAPHTPRRRVAPPSFYEAADFQSRFLDVLDRVQATIQKNEVVAVVEIGGL